MQKYCSLLILSLLFISKLVMGAEPVKIDSKDLRENLEESDSYWELDLGLAVSYGRNIIKGLNDDENGDFNPDLIISGGYYYKDLFVEVRPAINRPLTLGYSLQRTDKFVVNLIAESLFLGYTPEEQVNGNYLDGLDDRKISLDLGIEAYYTYKYGEARFRVVHDVGNSHRGYVLAFDYAYPVYSNRWVFWPSYGISWLSANTVDYYYGVDQSEARADRPFYQPGGSLEHRFNFYAAYQYDAYLSFITYGRYTLFGSNIEKSPLVNVNQDSFTIGLGVLWSF